MAVATVETIIANPARKRKRNMGLPRNASLKQRLHFGSKRQRAAAAASMKRKRKHRPAAKKRNPARAKRRVSAFVRHIKGGSGIRRATRSLFRKRTNSARRRKRNTTKRRHNPGEIIALTALNPARKRRSMARSRRHSKRRRASAHTGHRRRRVGNPARRHHSRKHNPGQIGSMVRSAAFAGVGFLGSKVATQAILGANNTGGTGYLGNAVATGILSFATHMFTKNKMDSFMVGVGGVLNILGRIIADNSLLGSYSSQLGMGDYLVANWWVPQRLDGNPFSLATQAYDMSWMPPAPVPIASAAPPGMGYLPAPIPSVYGNDLY